MNKGGIQNICLREDKDFHLFTKIPKTKCGEILSWWTFVPKQRSRYNQTVIGRNEHYDTIIVFETKDSQIPTNKEQENGETNDSFLFHGQSVTNGNQLSAWFCILKY